MGRIFTDEYLILQADGGETVVSNPITARNYKVAKFTVVVEGFTGTLQFVGSDSDGALDFSADADDDNRYSPLQVVDYDAGGSIPGSTGIDFSASPYDEDGVYNFEANSNGLSDVGAKVSGGAAGSIKVYAKFYDQKDD